jgi:hypothetical protein
VTVSFVFLDPVLICKQIPLLAATRGLLLVVVVFETHSCLHLHRKRRAPPAFKFCRSTVVEPNQILVDTGALSQLPHE